MIGLSTIQARLLGAAVAIIALLCIAAALYGAGVQSGEESVQAKWDASELAHARAAREALEANDRRVRVLLNTFNTTNEKVSQDHAKELDALRRASDRDRAAVDRAGGLRISAAACRDPAARPEAAGAEQPDEAGAATIRLPREIENDLWNQADSCDALSAQIRGLHEWVRKFGFYGSDNGANVSLLDRMIAAPNQPEESHGN